MQRERENKELIKEPEARRESGFLSMMRRTTEQKNKREDPFQSTEEEKDTGGIAEALQRGLLPSPGAVRSFVSPR